jgi:UDP-N-acetylmuramate--alanine ligase
VAFEARLSVIGKHNAKNALAAAALALHLGIPCEQIKTALESFSGIERRLEVIGERGGAMVYYDYAHHPTEIKNAIEAVRSASGGKIAIVFKPHTYSRTSFFLKEFCESLSLADKVYLCEISAIRELNSDGISSRDIVKAVGKKALYVENEKNIAKNIDTKEFSAIIIMGAAELSCVRNSILENKF